MTYLQPLSKRSLLIPIILVTLVFGTRTAIADGPISSPFATYDPIAVWFDYPTHGNSLLDHTSPTYAQNSDVTLYDGRYGNIANCDSAFSRAYATSDGECLYYDGHDGIDYAVPGNTDVLAAVDGTINVYYNDGAWGNRATVTGRGYETWYAHLLSFVVTSGTVARGQHIAESGNTGSGSTGYHLHFGAHRTDTGEVIDLYGWTGIGSDPWTPDPGNRWVGHSPILMGYQDQDGNPHGPYKIDNNKIHQKWLELNGDPGSPVEDDWLTTCVPEGLSLQATLRIQGFERGYIQYCGSATAEYIQYARTFLPDIRSNLDGWTSFIVIRNNGSADSTVNVSIYSSEGYRVESRTHKTVPANGLWVVDVSNIIPTTVAFSGSGVIAASSQDVAVVVENLASGEATNYNGVTPSNGLGNAGWGRAGTTIFAPSVKYQYGGRTGRLYILSTGSSNATITPEFRPQDNGTLTTCSSFTLSPLERRVYDAHDCGLSTNGQLYGAKLTSTQPLAVVLVEQNDSGAALTASSNAFSTGVQDNDNYAPLIKSSFPSNNPNSSGIVVQNASPSSTSSTLVDVYYYDSDSSAWWWDSATIQAVSSHVFWAPDKVDTGQVASAWISGGDKLVSTVYETKLSGSWRMQHSGFLAGSTTVILPRIYKNHSDGSATWSTGIQVQNTGTTQANVTVRYYFTNGDPDSDADDSAIIQPKKSVTFYQPANSHLGDEPNDWHFVGSAVITSDQPIVAVVNVSANNGSGDAAMSYNGFNR